MFVSVHSLLCVVIKLMIHLHPFQHVEKQSSLDLFCVLDSDFCELDKCSNHIILCPHIID